MHKFITKLINSTTCPCCNQYKETKKIKKEDEDSFFWTLIDVGRFECHMYMMNHGYLRLCSVCHKKIKEDAAIYYEAKKQHAIHDEEIRKKRQYEENLKKAIELKELEKRAVELGIDIEQYKQLKTE